MKPILRTLFISTFICLNFSFIGAIGKGIEATYGVCNSANSKVELDLMPDFTFRYKDHSDPSNPIDLQGTYSLSRNTIQLNSEDSEVKFHNKWKLSEEGKVVKARMGMSFYRLAKINPH